MPVLVGGLPRRGPPEETVARVIGGNSLRVFAEALAAEMNPFEHPATARPSAHCLLGS